MIVKRGDIIESEFGKGKIVAITSKWIIHEVYDGESEVAISKCDDCYWIPVECFPEDIDESNTTEVPTEE